MISARIVGDRVLCGRQYATGHYCDRQIASVVRVKGWPHPVVMWDSTWRWRTLGDGVLTFGNRQETALKRQQLGYSATRRGNYPGRERRVRLYATAVAYYRIDEERPVPWDPDRFDPRRVGSPKVRCPLPSCGLVQVVDPVLLAR